jgi:hypothetical protein
MDVFLNNHWVSRVNLAYVSGDKYSAALAGAFGLHDQGSVATPIVVFTLHFTEHELQLSVIAGQNPSFGVKRVIFWLLLSHSLQIEAKLILLCQIIHPWEVIASLVISHLGKCCPRNVDVVPDYVAVDCVVVSDLKPKDTFCYLTYHSVIQVIRKKHQ